MAAKARSWTIAPPKRAPALDVATRKAIRANAKQYLTPAFKGASHLGILKLAESLPDWIEIAKRPTEDLALQRPLRWFAVRPQSLGGRSCSLAPPRCCSRRS